MTRAWLLALLAGCGRLGFDPLTGDGGSDASIDSGADANVAGYPEPFDNLLVWYTMDDSPLDGAHDDSGQGRDALNSGGAPALVLGQVVQAFDYPAMSYARVTNVPAFNNLTAFTIAFWVNPSKLEWSGVSKTVGVQTANSFELGTNPIGELQLCTADNVNTSFCKAAPAVLPLGAWTHAAGVWDGTMMFVYVNGVLMANAPRTNLVFDTNDVMIGAEESNSIVQYFIEGTLDDVRLYQRALMPTEIAGLAAP